MAMQLSVAVRNARLDATETTTGTAPKLLLYTGSPPASCAAAATGSLLATLTLPSDWAANAANGSKVLNAGPWSGNASAGGTIGYFRLMDSAGTTCHIQGTVGQASGDLPWDNPVIVTGQYLQITTFTLNEANA